MPRLSYAQITRESSFNVLSAYRQAMDPVVRGEIYAKEISPRLDADENVFQSWPRTTREIHAMNTLGTLPSAMVSQRILELLVSKRALLDGVIANFSGETAAKGDVLTTRIVGMPTVQDFNGTASAASDTDISVTLNYFKEAKFQFTASEVVGTTRNLIGERAEANALAIGNYLADTVAALITEANFGTTNQTIQASGWDWATIASIARKLTAAGAPYGSRFGWVNAAVAEALENDSLMAFRRDSGVVDGTRWTGVRGFRSVEEFPALPANSCNLAGFFGSKSSLIVASRAVNAPPSLSGTPYEGIREVVTDPGSGLSLVRNDYYDEATWLTTTRLVILFGVAVGRADCGHTLVTAA